MDPQSAKKHTTGFDAEITHLRTSAIEFSPEARIGEILGEYLTIRFSETIVSPTPLVTELALKASHPKLPHEVKTFDLSHLLYEGYRASPLTVRQIVDPSLTPENRVDALRTLIVDICKVRGNVPPSQVVATATSTCDDIIDELEPTFAIRTQLMTELGDVVRGYSRRAVTVVRNNTPLVKFLIIEQEGALRHASMFIQPSRIELPLLDHHGRYVTDNTLDAALHDLTHHLWQIRHAPTPIVMESLGRVIRNRVAQNEEASELLKRRAFEQEAWSTQEDDPIWPPHFLKPQISPILAPAEFGYTLRELPDGRAFWIHHDIRNQHGNIIHLTGYSLSGSRFSVQLCYPPNISWRVAGICEQLLVSSGWPDFSRALEVLRSSKSGGVSLEYSPGTDHYPAAVNSLLDAVRGQSADRNIDLGLWPDKDGRMEPYFGDMVTEFVKGRLPFHGSVGGCSPASCWVFNAMLDEDLNGSVIFVNSLKGRLTMSSLPGSNVESRRHALMEVFNAMYESPSKFLGEFHRRHAFEVTVTNLPRWGGAESYRVVDAMAISIWNSIKRCGHYFSVEQCGHAPWRVERLPTGEWALSLDSIHSVRGDLPYLLTCVIDQTGAREILISYGKRGPFGGLLGKRIVPNGGSSIFSENEVGLITHTLTVRSLFATHRSVKSLVQSVCPNAQVSWISSLRRFDPQFKQRDMIARIARWFKNLW